MPTHYESWEALPYDSTVAGEYGMCPSSYLGSFSPRSSAATSNPDNFVPDMGVENDCTHTQSVDVSSSLSPSSASDFCTGELKPIEPDMLTSIMTLIEGCHVSTLPALSSESTPEDISSLIDSITGLFTPDLSRQ